MNDEGIYEYVAIDRRNQNEKRRIRPSVSNRNKFAPKSSILNRDYGTSQDFYRFDFIMALLVRLYLFLRTISLVILFITKYDEKIIIIHVIW